MAARKVDGFLKQTADVLICGAGIAGISAAYHLAVKQGIRRIMLVDERPPLTLTSDKGTEGYRNWWPDATMMRFISHSIDLLEGLAEASGDAFQMNRRGYTFFTADPAQIPQMQERAAAISALGAGPVRQHPGPDLYLPAPAEGWRNLPIGIDVILDPALIRQHFPFVTADVVAMTHVRRCGWLDSQRLGHWLRERAQAQGVQLIRDRVTGVRVKKGRVQIVFLESGAAVSTETFVIAAGPHLKQMATMLGVDVPVFNELHGKMTLADRAHIVPPTAPFLFWQDPQHLPWTAAERQKLAANAETGWLLEQFPGGVHVRPRGDALLLIWTYDVAVQEPVWPPTFNPYYGEVLLRGLARLIPGLATYFGQAHKGVVDGGYYCKTRENRPLIGPLPIDGSYVIGALSGYGYMGSQAAAELLATHISGGELPDYAPAFLLGRYEDPSYQKLLANWDARWGQM